MPSFFKRFSAGVRLNILGMNMQRTTGQTSNPNATTSFSQARTPVTGRLGGGVTIEYTPTLRTLVTVDLLYRWFGYQSSTVTNITLPDGTSQITTSSQATSARFWDLPILVRYTSRPARKASARFVGGAGVTFRRVSNLKSSMLTILPDGTQTTDNTPPTPLNRTSYGLEAAMGFRVRDDFGIKFMPEVRYIRWLSNMFNSWPSEIRKNELQVSIGLTF